MCVHDTYSSASSGVVEPLQQLSCGALAASACADESDGCARLHSEAHPPQDGHGRAARVAELHVVELDRSRNSCLRRNKIIHRRIWARGRGGGCNVYTSDTDNDSDPSPLKTLHASANIVIQGPPSNQLVAKCSEYLFWKRRFHHSWR